MSIVLVGSMQTMSVSLNSGKVIQSFLSENDLKMALTNLILDEDSCKENLKPGGGLTETTPDKGIGTISILKKHGEGSCSDPTHTTKADCEGASETWNVSGEIDVITSGERFNNNLEIMAITLSGDNTEDPMAGEVKRTLIVYYKKPGLGKMSTLGGRETDSPDCTATNQEDCYFKQCDIEYKIEVVSGSTEVTTCEALNCFSNELLLAKNKEEPRYCVLVDCKSCGCVQWADQYQSDGTEAIPRKFRRKAEKTDSYYIPGPTYSHRYHSQDEYLYFDNAKALTHRYDYVNPTTTYYYYEHERNDGSIMNLRKRGYTGNPNKTGYEIKSGGKCCPSTYGRDYL